jgi:hypothetical protein
MYKLSVLLGIALLAACSGTSVHFFDETLVEGHPKTVASPPLRIWTAVPAQELAAALAVDYAVTSEGDEVWLVAHQRIERGGPVHRRLQLRTEIDAEERAEALLDGRCDAAFVARERLERFSDRSRFRLYSNRVLGPGRETRDLVTTSRLATDPPLSSEGELEFWGRLLLAGR